MRRAFIPTLAAAVLLLSGCGEREESAPQEERATLPAPPSDRSQKSAPQAAASETATTGESLYRSCIPCHGAGGQQPALGVGEAIAGWSEERLIEVITAYRTGSLNNHGMGGMMSSQVLQLSDGDIEQLAHHIANL